jgi:hypothetical protein
MECENICFQFLGISSLYQALYQGEAFIIRKTPYNHFCFGKLGISVDFVGVVQVNHRYGTNLYQI